MGTWLHSKINTSTLLNDSLQLNIDIINLFHFTGGKDGASVDAILQYNPFTDTWTEAGQLTEPKRHQASTTVADVPKCIWIILELEL